MKLTWLLSAILILLVQNSYGKDDKLAHLRSTKKITTVNSVSAPYYTIQIVALRLPPENPEFFKNVDQIREFVCTDGYVRYTVGEFTSFKLAAQELSKYKDLGYNDVFVLDLRKISLGNNNTPGTVKVPSKVLEPVPGVNYTVQIAAYRFPVYLTHFEQVDNVKEYYMKDKIYRYCVGVFDGKSALKELEKIQQKGYKDAYLVELNEYAPFLIE